MQFCPEQTVRSHPLEALADLPQRPFLSLTRHMLLLVVGQTCRDSVWWSKCRSAEIVDLVVHLRGEIVCARSYG